MNPSWMRSSQVFGTASTDSFVHHRSWAKRPITGRRATLADVTFHQSTDKHSLPFRTDPWIIEKVLCWFSPISHTPAPPWSHWGLKTSVEVDNSCNDRLASHSAPTTSSWDWREWSPTQQIRLTHHQSYLFKRWRFWASQSKETLRRLLLMHDSAVWRSRCSVSWLLLPDSMSAWAASPCNSTMQQHDACKTTLSPLQQAQLCYGGHCLQNSAPVPHRWPHRAPQEERPSEESARRYSAAGGLALPHQQERAGFVLSARFHDNKR